MKEEIKKVRDGLKQNSQKLLRGAFFIGTWPTRKIEEGLDIIYGYDTDSGVNPPIDTRAVSIFITCVLLSGFVTYYSLTSMGLSREAGWMFGIFVLACLLWMTEALPLFATALLLVGLQVILLANPGNWIGMGFEMKESPHFTYFIEPLSDPIIVLFLGGFIMARAAVKRGVDGALASTILGLFGKSPRRVLLGMMMITAFFSMWMSNTATATMMLTLLIPIFSQMPDEEKFHKGLLLAVPFAANIGGVGTPISSPPNAVAIGFLNSININILFIEWMLFAVPFAIIMLYVAYKLIAKYYPPKKLDYQIILEKKEVDGKGKYVIFVFLLTIILWLTESLHGLPTAVVALIPIVAFTATGLLTKKDINSLEWNILLLIAGGIALGRGITSTGLDMVLASFLPGESPYIFIILVVVTLIFSTIISNTATSNLLIPIGVSLAVTADGMMDSFLATKIAVGIALAASMAMSLPVSTAPNTIAYSHGKLEGGDFAKVGIRIGITAIVVIALGSLFYAYVISRFF
jgi:solute carrier family 13 (sodium-dependent dicarboxylate transporter), member 2/3/5